MGCGTLAALALTGAGAGAKMYAGQQEQNAMNNATNAELQQQQQFQKQGSQIFQNSLAQSTPQAAQQQIGQGVQNIAGATQASALPPVSLPQTGPTSNAARVSYSGQDAQNQRGAQANAGLQGYGNFTLQQGLKDLSANSQLGLLGNQAAASERVLPYMLQQAANSQAPLAGIGSLLGTAGQLVGIGSLTGAFGGGAAAAPTAGQIGALGAGFGPTTASFANSLPSATTTFGQSAFSPLMNPSSWMYNTVPLY